MTLFAENINELSWPGAVVILALIAFGAFFFWLIFTEDARR